MKVLLIVLLIFNVTAGAFAQITWNLSTSFNVDAFQYRTPIGMNNDRIFTDPSGVITLNPNLAGNQLRYFTQNEAPICNTNELRLGFKYAYEIMEFYFRINVDGLISPTSAFYGSTPIGGSPTLVRGGYGGSVEQFIRSSWDEWYVSAKPNYFRFLAGNINDWGETDKGRFDVHEFNVSAGARMNSFGILTPVSRVSGADYMAGINYISSDELEGNNLARSNRVINENYGDWYPYFLVSSNLQRFIPLPLILQIGADPGNAFNVFSTTTNAKTTANTLADAMLRIQGIGIAGLLSFDLTWHFRGNDSNTLDNWDTDSSSGIKQPDGNGRFAHSIGAYVWFLPDAFIGGLSFSLGYTSYFRVREDAVKPADGFIEYYKSPVFSGIDFRIQFTGLPDLCFTLNNNFSFAKTSGTDDTSVGNWGSKDRTIAAGLIGNELLGPNQEQHWLALYNGLYTDYAISWGFSAHLFLAHRFTVFTDNMPWSGTGKPAALHLDKEEFASQVLNAHAFLRFAVGSFTFQAGMLLEYINHKALYSYINGNPQEIWNANTGSGVGSKDRKIGTLTYAIPLRMIYNFRSR